jgi:succinate dehydrogenase subunit D
MAPTGPADPISMGDVLDWSDDAMVGPRLPRPAPGSAVPARSRVEAMLWGLFSAGGFVSALLIPVHVAILGIAFAAGWLPDDAMSYDRIHHLVDQPLTELYLLGLVSLPLFHWAHRFRFIVHHQLGLDRGKALVAVLCYGTALAATILTAIVLISI